MADYEHVFETYDKDEPIPIPDDAIGVTVDSFSDMVTVRYLVPVESSDERDR